MEWSEFLADAELNSGFRSPPDGEYLFKKVLHDIRHCLEIHRGCIELAAAMKRNIPVETMRLLGTLNSIVETWILQLRALQDHSGKHEKTSPEWARQIAEMGKIINMPALQSEIEPIESCDIEEVKQLALIAKRNATTFNLLWQDIQAQNYKRLWMTLNYRDLLSSDFS